MDENQDFFEQEIRVNGFECDFRGHWKPAAIFQHLTETAGVHADRLGFGYNAMLAKDLYWVHSRMKIKFFSFPHTWQRVTIRTWPKTIQQKLFFIRDFEVLDEQCQKLAVATSAWLVINAATRHMVPTQQLNLALPSQPEKFGLNEPLDKLGLSQKGEEALRVKAGYSAVDILGHVNNSRYVEWICDCFPVDAYQSRQLDWLQINYDHEIRPGEEVALLVDHPEGGADSWTVEGINCNNQTRAFECALGWKMRE